MPDAFPKTFTEVRWNSRNDTGNPIIRTVTVPRQPTREETLQAAAEAAGVLFIEDSAVISIQHKAAALTASGSPADPSTSTFQSNEDNLRQNNSYRLPLGHVNQPRQFAPNVSRPPKWEPLPDDQQSAADTEYGPDSDPIEGTV